MAGNQIEIRVVASGAEAAAKVLQSVGQAGGQIGSITASGTKQAEGALRSLGSTAKEVFTIFTGFAIGSLFIQGIESIKHFTGEVAKLGLEAKVQEDAFARLSRSVGVAGDILVAEMNKAAGGILNTSDVMIAAAKALNQSLQPEQIVNLMTIARQQSKLAGIDVSEAFNRITEAIANQQPRALKQLGIVIDMDAAMKKHAATLGVEVDRLSEAGKAQAAYLAVAEQTKNSVAALTNEGLTQSEMVQKMAAAWKQAKEDIGKFVVDVGFTVLTWMQDVKTALGDMTPLLTQLGAVWAATWATTTVNFAPIKTEVSGLKVFLQDLALVFAQVGFGISTVFMVTAGAAAGIGSLLDDLGHKQIPDVGKAMETAIAKQKEAFAAWTDGRKALQDLAAGMTETKTKTDDMGTSTSMGTNKLADLSNQIKPLIPDLKALQSAVAGIAAAFKALSDEATRGVLPEDEFTKLNGPLDAFRDKMRDQLSTLGLSKAAIQALDASLAGLQARLVDQVSANRAVLEESKADLDTLKEKWDAGAKSIEAMEFEYAKWLKSLNADGALDEAEDFYKNLAENIDAGAKSFESMQSPVDDAARATQAFQDALQGIAVQAELLGHNFDATGATISVMQRRLMDLAKDAQGVITPEMRELGDAISGMIDETRLRDALGLTRTTFDALVDLARSTAQNMTSAFSDLFFNIFSGNLKSAADVFKSFVLSMIRSLSNFLAEAVTKRFLGFLFAAATPGTTASAAAAVVAGGGGGAADTGGGGLNTAGFAPGEVGGAPLSSTLSTAADATGSFVSGLQAATGGMSGLTNVMTGATNAWTAFNASLDAGEGLFHSLGGAFDSFMVPLSGAATAASSALAGAGAAIAAFSSIMDIVNGQTSAGIGGLVGGVALGAAGAYFAGPFGAFLGYAIGDLLGSWIGGLFGGGPSNYDLKRIGAADSAAALVGGVGTTFRGAATSGNRADVLSALQSGQAPAGSTPNPLRTDLVLSSALAAQLGLTGETEGDKVIIHWAQVNAQQFDQLLELFKAHPDMIASSIRGGGDVSYLTPDKVRAYTDALQQGAVALVTAFAAFDTVRDKINTMATDLKESISQVLPPDLADRFAHGIVDPIHDRMLAVLSSGLPVEEMQKQLDALDKELHAWVGLVALYGQVTQDIAALSGDLATQTGGAMLGIETVLRAANKAISDAQAQAGRAVGPEQTLAAETTLRTAILQRYATEMQLVQKIQATIDALLKAASTVAATLAGLAVADLARGDATAFTEILGSLADMAMVAPTVAQRLFAVNAGFSAIITALTNGDLGKTLYPLGIIASASAAAAPFFGALADMIEQATNAGDLQGALALLQQQAEAIKQLGAAAVEAVKNWAAAAIAAVEKQAAADLKAIDERATAEITAREAAIKGWQTQLDLTLKWEAAVQSAGNFIESLYTGANSPLSLTQQRGLAGNAGMAALTAYNANPTPEGLGALQAAASRYLTIALAQIREKADAEIAAVNEAKDARVAALNDELTALQAQVQATREWEDVVKLTAALIQALRIGPLGAGNPADRLAAAKDAFARAQADFAAHPSPATAAAVQAAGQALLPLAESVLSKPSPAYQALFAGVIAALERVQGTAGALAGPVTSADLDAQTKVIQQQLADANKNAADTIATINAAAAQEAKDITAGVIDALEAAVKLMPTGPTPDDLKTLIAGAQAEIDWWTKWREEQGKLVDAQKQAQIEAINATAQTTIDNIEAGVSAALRANAAAQTSITDKLLGVQLDQLNAITGGAPVQTFMAEQAQKTVGLLGGILDALNRAIPAESGMARVTEGLYHLHDDEMVIPKGMADKIRSAQEGAGLGNTPAGSGNWDSPFFRPRDLAKESQIWAGPGAAELNDLERRILLLQVQYGATLSGNTYKSGGKIYQHHDAAQLATMKATLDAQVSTLRSQQNTIIASIPKTPPAPPPGTTTPTPPSTPPGPAWLSRGSTDATRMGGAPTVVFQITGSKQDADAIASTIKQVLPAVLADAKNGKLGTVIDNRAKAVRK